MLCSRGLGGMCGSNRCVVVKQCDIEDVMKCIVPLESVGVWCIQEMNRSVVIGGCVRYDYVECSCREYISYVIVVLAEFWDSIQVYI